ncbi:MurR/RpiR family transcriptional regulator [Maritalea sp. S77]|jgi:RpiR family carbohydrate utilization transcriptional regulator|uniref:MurR/RpiR family transcriptional regulator n=1 Tax=Maritalea sp. S77 TaxID=3415125 RepID=UPI003C7D5169
MSDTALDIISQIRQKDGSYNAREQRVATYVLDNLEQVSDMSVASLAAACEVSEPTVIRFCRTLGCTGYRDFKIRLAQNVAVSLQYLISGNEAEKDQKNLIDQVFQTFYVTANVARSQLNEDIIKTAASHINAAQKIIFCGVGGGSTTVAFDAANRFFRLGFAANAVSDAYLQRMHAATLTPQDVMVFISATGLPRSNIDSAKVARQYGAKTIALTKPESPLAHACDFTIGLSLPEDPDIYKPTASRLVFLATIDILAATVARQRPEHTKENLRRIRSSLTALHGNTGPQPVGD